jgi:hypothetical protein
MPGAHDPRRQEARPARTQDDRAVSAKWPICYRE